MSLVIEPSVLHMILCDEVLRDPQRPGKLTIAGLITLLRWPTGTSTPLHLEQLVILLILTDGRGTGRGRIRCINAVTGVSADMADLAVAKKAKVYYVTSQGNVVRLKKEEAERRAKVPALHSGSERTKLATLTRGRALLTARLAKGAGP